MKYGNRQVYNEYLIRSREQRESNKTTRALMQTYSKGAPNRMDPNAVDMGMARGLDEPLLHVPVADEPLWLAKAEKAVSLSLLIIPPFTP